MRTLLTIILLTAPISALADDVKGSLYSLAQASASMYVQEYHGARAKAAEPYIEKASYAYGLYQQKLEYNHGIYSVNFDYKNKRAHFGIVIPFGG